MLDKIIKIDGGLNTMFTSTGNDGIIFQIKKEDGTYRYSSPVNAHEIMEAMMLWVIAAYSQGMRREKVEYELRTYWYYMHDLIDEAIGPLDESKYLELQKKTLIENARSVGKEVNADDFDYYKALLDKEKEDLINWDITRIDECLDAYDKYEKARDKEKSELLERLKEAEAFAERLKEKHKKEIVEKEKQIKELTKEIRTLEHRMNEMEKARYPYE